MELPTDDEIRQAVEDDAPTTDQDLHNMMVRTSPGALEQAPALRELVDNVCGSEGPHVQSLIKMSLNIGLILGLYIGKRRCGALE